MYEFNWEGKELAYKLAQTPSTGTLIPDKESSKNWDTTENLYIEGDNLEVLKLLQKSYFGKVKMIYIDPPYNTGNDFVYHDNFRDNIANYKEITNQTTRANSETNGRYHTDWLNMMYPRLKLARNLLREDGVIFISIDDNELNNLKKICDEIFGEENFNGIFVVNSTPNGRDYGYIAKMHEYSLFYSKNKEYTKINLLPDTEKIFKYSDAKGGFNIHPLYNSNVAFTNLNRPNLYYPFYLNTSNRIESDFYEISLEKKEGFIEIYPPKSKKDSVQFVWRWGKEKSKEGLNKEIVGYKSETGEYRIVQKMRTTEKVIRSIQSDTRVSSRRGTAEVESLFGKKIFSFPKPLNLVKNFINAGSDNDSIILDFFSGSSTTAHATIELNSEDNGKRKLISVQLPECTDINSDSYKAGYKNICEIGKERIRRAGDKIVSENKDKEGIENLDIGFKVFKLAYNNLNNKEDDKMYNGGLMNPIKIEILANKKPKELKGKKKITTINKDADYKVQVFIDDDYNLYYLDNHAFASCESKIVDNKVETTWNSCKCWFKISGLYECKNNHIVDILRDLNSYSEYLYPKNNVADNMALSRLYEQMVNVYLDYVND